MTRHLTQPRPTPRLTFFASHCSPGVVEARVTVQCECGNQSYRVIVQREFYLLYPSSIVSISASSAMYVSLILLEASKRAMGVGVPAWAISSHTHTHPRDYTSLQQAPAKRRGLFSFMDNTHVSFAKPRPDRGSPNGKCDPHGIGKTRRERKANAEHPLGKVLLLYHGIC